MSLNKILTPYYSGTRSPTPGYTVNNESSQARGLYWHAPLFEHRHPGKSIRFYERISGHNGIVLDGGGNFAITEDSATGLFYPNFPGTGAGNSTHCIGFTTRDIAPVAAFGYTNNQKIQVNPPRMSWGIWLKPTSVSHDTILFAERQNAELDPYSNWTINYLSTGAIQIACSSGSVGSQAYFQSSASTVVAGSWQHIMGVFDGLNVRCYYNGALLGSTAAAFSVIGNSTTTTRIIGSSPQQIFATYCVDGLVGDARLYNYALGASEIKKLYTDRWGLWAAPKAVVRLPGNVYLKSAAVTFDLASVASSGVARSVSGSSTFNLAALSSNNVDRAVSASSTFDLAISTHTQNIPISASSSFNLAGLANNAQTFSVSATNTFDLASVSSARNTILRVSAETSMNFGMVDQGGGDFIPSPSSTFDLASLASGHNTSVIVAAINFFNLQGVSYAVGSTLPVFAGSDILFSDVAGGGKLYSASAASSIALTTSLLTNTFGSSAFNLASVASAHLDQGPAASTFAITSVASSSLELPSSNSLIRKSYYSGISKRFPVHYAETPRGVLLIADGIDSVLRWDGISRNFYPAGIIAPTTAPVISYSGSGSITGTYTAYVRFVDDEGNVSNLSPISNSITSNNSLTISYASVPVSAEGRVVLRQIIRNTDGQATTYYVDVETSDLTSTTFSSTKTDAVLATQEAVVLLDSNNEVIINIHAPPPNYKAVPVSHLNRMFLAVDVEYKEGSIQVTKGSTTVMGVGTRWPSTLVGRELYVVGSNKAFEVTAVDVTNQSLTIDSPYEAGTEPFAVYAIRAQRSERRLVYYSESGLPESWPATNAFSLQDDGDEITGMVVQGSFLYVVEKRHIYRFTFQIDPATDGFVFLATSRGSVNQRCIVQVEDDLYMLDESGVHKYNGGQSAESLSVAIQNLFRPGEPNGINWLADKRLWHASHAPTQDTIRWFVALAGSKSPRHALCFNYRQERWWVEEYTATITGSALASLGYRRPLVGSDARRILALDQGALDGPEPQGDLSGVVDSAGPMLIVDSGASYTADGVVNSPVWITKGRGIGQSRRVVSVSSGQIVTDRPWAVTPDSTSSYQVGGIYYEWNSQWFRYSNDESSNSRSLELGFSPHTDISYASIRTYIDYAVDAQEWGHTRVQDGVEIIKGSSVISLDLRRQRGAIRIQMSGHGEDYSGPPQFTSIQLAGVQGVDLARFWSVKIEGVEGGSVRQ